jgi:hypothetical protein
VITDEHLPRGGDPSRCGPYLGRMSLVGAIAVGGAIGLALGIVVSVTTDVPLAPEVGLALGALIGWLSRRSRP